MATEPKRRWMFLVSVSVAVALPIAIAIPYVQTLFQGPLESDLPAPALPLHGNRPFWNSPFIVPGIDRPPITAGHEATLGDDEEVIGVTIERKHRAYRIASLRKPPHVANDLVDGTPVTATYCPNSDLTQAFTADGLTKPLPVSLGGWMQGSMVLRFDRVFFLQRTGQSPDPEQPSETRFTLLPHKRTTWKTWRETNPGTDICMSLDR